MNATIQSLRQRSNQLERSRKNLEKAELEYRKTLASTLQGLLDAVMFLSTKLGR
jgi:hypothetical protein